MFNLEAGSKRKGIVSSSPKANASQLAGNFLSLLKPVVGLKKDLKRKRGLKSDNQMVTQVKKILEQKGQGLIVMVRG